MQDWTPCGPSTALEQIRATKSMLLTIPPLPLTGADSAGDFSVCVSRRLDHWAVSCAARCIAGIKLLE